MVRGTKTLAADPSSPLSCKQEVPPHTKTQIGLRSGKFGSQVKSSSANHSRTLCAGRIIPLKHAAAISEYQCHEGVYLVCNSVSVGVTCQIDIHMTGRTQCFPAEHFPEHQTSSTGLSSYHSTSLLQVNGVHVHSHPHQTRQPSYTAPWSSSNAPVPIMVALDSGQGSSWVLQLHYDYATPLTAGCNALCVVKHSSHYHHLHFL